MRQSLRNKRSLSEGERARALAFLLVAVFSSALGYLAVLHINKHAFFEELTWYETWIVAAAGLGGAIGLFLSGDRMGQSGGLGVLRGLAGGVWVTFYGALIGGTLALPFYGTMFGPFVVSITLLGAPLLSILWIVHLMGIHILLGIYQRERDSIFKPSRMTRADDPDALSVRMRGRFT